MSKYSFNKYLEGFSKNDNEVIRHFYLTQRPKIIKSLASRYGVDEDKAKDAFQNSMMEVFTRIRLGKVSDKGAEFSTYFYKVCSNQLLKILRKRDEKLLTIPEHVVYTASSSPDESPDAQVLDREKVENEKRILELVKKLRAKSGKNCGEVIRLRFEEGLKLAALGARLGYSEGTTKVKLHRCMSKLREILKADSRYRAMRNLSDWGWDL